MRLLMDRSARGLSHPAVVTWSRLGEVRFSTTLRCRNRPSRLRSDELYPMPWRMAVEGELDGTALPETDTVPETVG